MVDVVGTPVDSPEVLARIEEGLELVNVIARSTRRQFGGAVQLDDLTSHGREALLGAARSFDPSRQIPFRSWAGLRIRGAMFDSMRQSGNLPKRVYRKLRALQAADDLAEVAAEEAAAAPPASPEAADAKLGERLESAAMAMALGFLKMKSGDDALAHVHDPDRSPESAVGHAELVAHVRSAIEDLPDAERTLVRRHYFEGARFDEVAKELGLSKSWASRLHTRAIEALVRRLKRTR